MTIAFLRQVRYIFMAEILMGQELVVPHQSRKRYILLLPLLPTSRAALLGGVPMPKIPRVPTTTVAGMVAALIRIGFTSYLINLDNF
jgi:hypothetical protein